MRKVNQIILHCSDSDLATQDAQLIDSWHKARGWRGIGYHYFIQKSGKLEQGRRLDEVGAHCRGHNWNSVGICLAGRKRFNTAQFDALKSLLGRLKKRFPKATVHGHNEFDPGKTCPVYSVKPFKDFYEKGETKWKSLHAFLRLFQKLSKLFSRS